MELKEPVGAALLDRRAERLVLPGSLRQCVFVRVNAPIFYSVATASFLEATARAFAERAITDFSQHASFCSWLESTWLPERQARVTKLREYIAVTWPEFDWPGAKDRVVSTIEGYGLRRNGPPSEKALVSCTATAQSTLFYRCLARWVDDRQLRELAQLMARQDESAFGRFREALELTSRQQRLGLRAEWRTIRSSVRAARDLHVQTAFEVLVAAWGPNAPFPQLTYEEFASRVAAAVAKHVKLGWQERIFFNAWKARPRPLVPASIRHTNRGFKPVLAHREPKTKLYMSGQWRP